MSAELHIDARLQAGPFRLDVSLHIEAGPVLLVGPNGAGKTTLLRALAGGPVAVDGTLRVRGEAWVEGGRTRPPEARRVGWLPQGGGLFPHLDVLDNVAFGAPGTDRAARRSAARQALADHGLDHLAPRRPRGLSGGEAQRVALVRALVRDPVLLLLDEPLTALDIRARRDARQAITRALHAPARVGVASTHDPRDLRAWGGCLVLVDEGRAQQLGPLSTLVDGDLSPFLAELLAPLRA